MHGFLITGFGVGMLILIPLSLIENAAYSAFVLFRGEQKNSTKAIFIGTLIISATTTPVAAALMVPRPYASDYPLAVAVVLPWAWYFALIPQLILRKILFKRDTKTVSDRRLTTILLRIVLTFAILAGLYTIHGFLGYVIGIPSD